MTRLIALTILVLLLVTSILLGACGRDTAPAAPVASPEAATLTQASSAAETTAPNAAPVSTVAEAVVTVEAPASPVEPQVTQQAPTATLQAPAPSPVVDPSPAQAPAEVEEPTPADTSVVIDGSDRRTAAASAISLGASIDLPTTEIVKILTPSVVHISTELARTGQFMDAVPPTGMGTGVILSLQGHILTNNHVIEGADRITVTLHDGSTAPAEIVGRDPTTDLAVIVARGLERLTPATLGNSSELLVGQDVIAIGHALGLSGAPTVSKGVVSALERSLDTDRNSTIVDLIQTDASINPGNSGGPLVDSGAAVIGINTAIIRGGQGIGFAINIDDAKVVAQQLIDQGFVRRGYLGVLPSPLTPPLAAQLGLDPDTNGILLREVIPGTAAASTGLMSGDIILSLGGQPLVNNGELSKFLIEHQPGDTVAIVILRDGNELTAEITLGERPDN